jgi:flagellar basal-body rod modification protein FlgD
MSINPAASAAASASASGSSSSTVENPSNELGKNDFLQLMVAQLQAQDPLEPTSDTEYVAELAQFSQLEQTTNLAQSNSEALSAQKTAQAVQLIGHTVAYKDPVTGETVDGKVESVEITSAGAALTIEGVTGIEPASFSEVSA